MSALLQVGPEFTLPAAIATHRNALLGMSGSGKSNASVVLAEEFHRARIPWIAIDPKGDWFGVRSSRDGKGKGLDVPVLGGEHGDFPLSASAGARLGELVATGKLTGVLDTSDFGSNADQSRFMAAFGEALLTHCRTPVHVFCDECDEYLPQPGAGGKLDGPAAACVGVWKRVAKKGRFRGIGFTLMSQRSALVNKTALYQCETLIAMRTMGELDRKAIQGWLDQLGDANELMKSLPRLQDGEAWIWSPHRLKMEKRVRFRRRETFDSGRTPEIGEAPVVPTLAKLDLQALREELDALEDDAPASGDADALRAKLAAANKEIARLRTERTTPAVPVLTQDDRNELVICGNKAAALELELGRLRERLDGVLARHTAPSAPPRPTSAQSRPEVVHRDAKPQKTSAGQRANSSHSDPSSSGLSKCARSLLTALAQHGDLSLVQAAIIACYAPDSGGVRNAAGELRAGGFVEGSNAKLSITDAGRAEVADAPKLPTGKKLAEYWYGKLERAERLILGEVVAAYPKALALKEAATRAGYEPSSGGVRNAAGKLRTLALVHGGNGGMTADRRLV